MSSKLDWGMSSRRWQLTFQKVKLGIIDQLRLVLYSPRAIYIFAYSGSAGLSTREDSTWISGHRITFYGPCGERQWAVALDSILGKLDASGCELLAAVDWSL